MSKCIILIRSITMLMSQWAIWSKGRFTKGHVFQYVRSSLRMHMEHIENKRSDLTCFEPYSFNSNKSEWDFWISAVNIGYAWIDSEGLSASLIITLILASVWYRWPIYKPEEEESCTHIKCFFGHLIIFFSTGPVLIFNLTHRLMSWHTEDQPAANSCESRHLRQ